MSSESSSLFIHRLTAGMADLRALEKQTCNCGHGSSRVSSYYYRQGSTQHDSSAGRGFRFILCYTLFTALSLSAWWLFLTSFLVMTSEQALRCTATLIVVIWLSIDTNCALVQQLYSVGNDSRSLSVIPCSWTLSSTRLLLNVTSIWLKSCVRR
jgi:hypothetical protein